MDKIAFLFKDNTLRPWPSGKDGNIQRRSLLKTDGEFDKTEKDKSENHKKGEWWINFYHVLDPVSGSLSAKFICGDNPPYNYHLTSGWIPAWTHAAYWKDKRMLRFILGRAYGSDYLEDKYFKPWPGFLKILLAIISYLFWGALLLSIIYALVYLIYKIVT